ncbi:hypothetical protein LZZ85_13425 [Terrimonas sp. NA20]|uniref:Universal stress protein n=1 Tax=Terrimonas ginsenosidimutans TaxID=2908004 RepID=A0ABS9KSJ9_9BACT|nr:hypothetical protein [Terrimonas ginsenosidimutans]MCG2615294.1 hypothetical protein [Terrimonas ginsenosidimutans]
MEKAYILFNGIQYSFEVVEAGISWALQSKVRLVALFVHAADAPKEGYIFPSDLDAAESFNTTGDASSSHLAIIQSNMKMLLNEARRHDVLLEAKELVDPEDDDLLAELADATMLFASSKIEEQGVLTVDSVDWQRLLHEHPSKVLNW